MDHGQVHAEFAAGRLSSKEAADIVMQERAATTKAQKPRNPFVLACLFLLACVASLLGIKTNESA